MTASSSHYFLYCHSPLFSPYNFSLWLLQYAHVLHVDVLLLHIVQDVLLHHVVQDGVLLQHVKDVIIVDLDHEKNQHADVSLQEAQAFLDIEVTVNIVDDPLHHPHHPQVLKTIEEREKNTRNTKRIKSTRNQR